MSLPACYLSSYFYIVSVVLNAERESLLETRRNFNIEAEERFVTLQNGVTGDNEKKFYEAVFMGNVEGSKGNRSTHTIDGKAYPMEIYLFFVDESLPVMNACTVLVILVEVQDYITFTFLFYLAYDS
jgi:hypothetical protein